METMDECINKVLEKAESIYNAKIVSENSLGNSSNMINERSFIKIDYQKLLESL